MSALVGNVGDDLSQAASWKQLPRLLMARVDQNGVWGPGHNFFFKSPDGTQDWQAYHAKISTNKTFRRPFDARRKKSPGAPTARPILAYRARLRHARRSSVGRMMRSPWLHASNRQPRRPRDNL